jgi:polygalacturonase
MHAILIANDASNWFESGSVQDVTIRNNTFIECGYNSSPGNFVIAIAPENHQQVPGYFVHRNIRIENNTFSVYDYPILTARSVDNLMFTGNTVKWTTLMKSAENRAGCDLTDCKNVTVKNNLFEMPQVPVISAKGMKKKDLRMDNKATILSIE